MDSTSKAIDICMITFGSTYSIANIENILGVIILIIQVIWIGIKLTYKIYNTIRNKNDIDNLDNDVNSFIDDLDELKDKISDKDGDNIDDTSEK